MGSHLFRRIAAAVVRHYRQKAEQDMTFLDDVLVLQDVEAYICSVLQVGVLPDGGLLAGGGGQAVLEPEDDQPRQAQQLQRALDEGLDQDVAHEEGGGLRR